MNETQTPADTVDEAKGQYIQALNTLLKEQAARLPEPGWTDEEDPELRYRWRTQLFRLRKTVMELFQVIEPS